MYVDTFHGSEYKVNKKAVETLLGKSLKVSTTSELKSSPKISRKGKKIGE